METWEYELLCHNFISGTKESTKESRQAVKLLQLPEIYMNKSPAPDSDATQDSII